MFSFRQKILITYLIVVLIFLVLMFPFAASTVKKIAKKGMQDRATELIAKIQSAPNNDALIRRLKEQKALTFFRISVINDERKILYDSHTKRLLGPRFSQEYVVDHPEVLEAFAHGTGYVEDYSDLLGQKFSYFAKSFDFHGKTYVMRTAFPYKYVTELTHDFEMGMIALASIILLLFSAMTWFIVHHLTEPIAQITEAVRPYQEGTVTTLPAIKINATASDEFLRLANTLNSLSDKIRKQIDTLTMERNEKEAVLESLVEGVIAVDENLTISYANQSAAQLLQFDPEKVEGIAFEELNQGKCLELLKACRKERKPQVDTLELKREGKKLFLDLVAAPKQNNAGAILVLQDKTGHHRIAEMRKDFVANASHELKTPLTIIRGFAETLHDHPQLSQETMIEITDKIVRNCNRMNNVIKDLLTLSDIENIPESRLNDCDLVKIAENCKEMVLNVHPTAEISIIDKSQKGVHLIADPSLMELAIMNLIENAAKYSLAPAQITVLLQDLGPNVQIEVADKGIGIPPHDLEHIFDKFYTVDKARSQKMGGSGLGLSIVQTIVDKHAGQISVASTIGKGTTFTIVLPHKG